MAGSTRISRWWHRDCERDIAALLTERDRLETEVAKLIKVRDEIITVNQALKESLVQFHTRKSLLEELFTEDEVADEDKQFLTPAWADREGEEAAT